MYRVLVLLRLGLRAVALAALGIAAAIVWALWPLPDSRFAWKPYYVGLLAFMRVELARDHGFEESCHPVWECRALGCWDQPAQAGYFLYRPRRATSTTNPPK